MISFGYRRLPDILRPGGITVAAQIGAAEQAWPNLAICNQNENRLVFAA
jgi:hypothetical protein